MPIPNGHFYRQATVWSAEAECSLKSVYSLESIEQGFEPGNCIDNKCNMPRFKLEVVKKYNGEFDPGSGRTLAACLTHASLGRKG
jgi:hypothetical protein